MFQSPNAYIFTVTTNFRRKENVFSYNTVSFSMAVILIIRASANVNSHTKENAPQSATRCYRLKTKEKNFGKVQKLDLELFANHSKVLNDKNYLVDWRGYKSADDT